MAPPACVLWDCTIPGSDSWAAEETSSLHHRHQPQGAPPPPSGLTFMLGLQGLALLPPADRYDLEGVLLGGVVVVDQQLRLLLRQLDLRLLATCSGEQNLSWRSDRSR